MRQHTAFAAKSRAEVDAFHAAALAAGATDNGPPGSREAQGYSAGYYAAFVFDLDGNNIEAVFARLSSYLARNRPAASPPVPLLRRLNASPARTTWTEPITEIGSDPRHHPHRRRREPLPA